MHPLNNILLIMNEHFKENEPRYSIMKKCVEMNTSEFILSGEEEYIALIVYSVTKQSLDDNQVQELMSYFPDETLGFAQDGTHDFHWRYVFLNKLTKIYEEHKVRVYVCPECDVIDDEDYTCTTCWGSKQVYMNDVKDNWDIEYLTEIEV